MMTTSERLTVLSDAEQEALQELVSETLSAERRRLGGLLAEVLDDEAKAALAQLLVRDETLS